MFVCEPGSTDCEECEKNLLEDDRIELGAKAFRAVKMSPDAAKADAILKEKGGKAVPRVVLVSSDLKTIKVLEAGTLKVSEVWGSMKTVANKHYKQDLDGVVKGLKDVCNEFNKLYAETKVLDEKEKRLTDKATPADRKEIETKRSALEERQKKVEAQRDKLLELKPKASKA